jgi:hypothetical protein
VTGTILGTLLWDRLCVYIFAPKVFAGKGGEIIRIYVCVICVYIYQFMCYYMYIFAPKVFAGRLQVTCIMRYDVLFAMCYVLCVLLCVCYYMYIFAPSVFASTCENYRKCLFFVF